MEEGSVQLQRDPRVDPAGIGFETRVVAFLDVLGATAQESSLEFLRHLVTSITNERRLWQKWPAARDLGFRSLWFSDNLGVSVRVAEGRDDRSAAGSAFDLVGWYVASVQARLLQEHGLASRAGMAMGDCYHVDHMVFGPALVAAVHSEHGAEHPQLVLHPTVGHLVAGSALPIVTSGTTAYVNSLAVGLPATEPARSAYIGGVRQAIQEGPVVDRRLGPTPRSTTGVLELARPAVRPTARCRG